MEKINWFENYALAARRSTMRKMFSKGKRATERLQSERKKYLIQSIIYKFCEESNKAIHFEINLFSHLDLWAILQLKENDDDNDAIVCSSNDEGFFISLRVAL